ncbi:hypothetical protein [Photobacterium sp.]|uniref:hypothetical protein n=1 Tax=Photobacterium sp. TaxID=660 RepID=UPI00299D1D22|nr:hypothetical protein [Photobacterium sp.]MDX1302181.1 hypothetical protein [Photobacterium sp.]
MKTLSPYHKKVLLLIGIAIVLILLALIYSPIRQSRHFYDYADNRTLLGIQNFWNVISNLPFLWVGFKGLSLFTDRHSFAHEPAVTHLYPFFFISMIMAFFGSSYYHLTPNHFTLMLDRIPITLTFITLYCIMLSEYVSRDAGRWLFFPMVVYGLLSVIYWYHGTQITGRGNIAAYVLVQVIPIIHFPLILYLFSPRFSLRQYYLYALIAYVIAKWAESNDDEIYAFLGGISGHSIKHLIAAIGGYYIYLGFKRRTQIR